MCDLDETKVSMHVPTSNCSVCSQPMNKSASCWSCGTWVRAMLMFLWLHVLLSNENGRACAAAGVLPVRIGSAGCGIVLCAAVDDVNDVVNDVLYVILSQTLSGRGEHSPYLQAQSPTSPSLSPSIAPYELAQDPASTV